MKFVPGQRFFRRVGHHLSNRIYKDYDYSRRVHTSGACKRGETMKLSHFTIAFVIFMPAGVIDVAVADSRCRTDSYGYANCRDSSGNTWRGRTDSFGNVLWIDNRGNTISGRADSFGNTSYRNNLDGPLRRRPSFTGKELWRKNSRYSIKGRRNSSGNTIFK